MQQHSADKDVQNKLPLHQCASPSPLSQPAHPLQRNAKKPADIDIHAAGALKKVLTAQAYKLVPDRPA